MEDNIHPQVRMLVAQLCEAFNIPLTDVKLKVWQDKLKIPNTDILRETYEQITDGRGVSLKMPSIAEFMQIYKEKERNFFNKKDAMLEAEYGKKKDSQLSKEMVPKLVNAILSGTKVKTSLCKMPHEGEQDGIKFRLTRDARGRDHCYFHNYSKNID